MFVKRLFDHLLNQVLVESLANSRWFQRFAVWSHGAMKDIQAKSKDVKVEDLTYTPREQPKLLRSQINSVWEVAKQRSSKFRAEFEQEMKKIQQQQQAKK